MATIDVSINGTIGLSLKDLSGTPITDAERVERIREDLENGKVYMSLSSQTIIDNDMKLRYTFSFDVQEDMTYDYEPFYDEEM